jgi:hypothetical protein
VLQCAMRADDLIRIGGGWCRCAHRFFVCAQGNFGAAEQRAVCVRC